MGMLLLLTVWPNPQDAVVAIAPDADVVLVVGSPNSSNSVRLTEPVDHSLPELRVWPVKAAYDAW